MATWKFKNYKRIFLVAFSKRLILFDYAKTTVHTLANSKQRKAIIGEQNIYIIKDVGQTRIFQMDF